MKNYDLLQSQYCPAGTPLRLNIDSIVALARGAHVLVEIDWRHVSELASRALQAKARRAQAGPVRVRVAPGVTVETVCRPRRAARSH